VRFHPVSAYPNANVTIRVRGGEELGDYYQEKLEGMPVDRLSLVSIVEQAVSILNRPFPGKKPTRPSSISVMKEFRWLFKKQYTIPPLQRFWR
jgi:hypothetical protein